METDMAQTNCLRDLVLSVGPRLKARLSLGPDSKRPQDSLRSSETDAPADVHKDTKLARLWAAIHSAGPTAYLRFWSVVF